MKIQSIIAAALVAMPFVARAQSPDTLSLLGRNALTFGFGITGTSTSGVTVDGVASHSSGHEASLQFSHWMRPTIAFQVSASTLGADATASLGGVHNNTLTPLLVGLSVSPRSFALSRNMRPYLSVGIGPYIHSVSDVSNGSMSSTVESAFGARFGVGTNWFIARYFILGLDGNYHAVSKFDHPDALTKDPSGFGLSLLFGFAWGKR